ncbi:hypothetical protein H6768_05960 [Candidatus Peribacteria bacterium]|nr:hypothetical protein [Candidatus Peribacteria bacterium]
MINTGGLIASFGFDESSDINTLLEKSEQSLFKITQTFIKNRLTHIRDILDMRYEEYAGIHEDPKQIEHSRVMT